MAQDRNARQLILDAAVAIIDRDGESASRVDRVVRDAGFTSPALREEVEQKNREFVERAAEFLAAIRDRWDLPYEFDPVVLAAWWVGLILSRHLIEADPSFVDPGTWDAITDLVVFRLLEGEG